eukprot:m.40308 g.40308  ORF g.40308 m.40308 type:complete len:68 (+) comp11354_c0_seq2:1455-1658(+)
MPYNTYAPAHLLAHNRLMYHHCRRQVISIVLSAVIFGHSFATQALLGIFIVFVAMFGRIYLRTQNKK